MDFFEQQQRLRWQTVGIVAAFIAAIIAIVVIIQFALWLSLGFYHHYADGTQPGFLAWSVSLIGILTAVIVVGQMIWAAAPRWRELRQGGGRALAERLGGTRVSDAAEDRAQRELVRVVEEMAVAAGLTPPATYVLTSEQSLNAFAAGQTSDDAAIAVTQGLLDSLDRDELQAVVAHEMSHIDNADTTLNMRLMVGVAAIASIGQLGLSQLEHAVEMLDTYSTSWNTDYALDDHSPLSWRGGWFGFVYGLLVGAILVAIGSAGLALAHVIKAAISRRREFLADAGAVQFSRNPDGLAGALLALHNDANHLSTARTNEVEHMLFTSLDGTLSRLLATHPPIQERMDALGIKYRQWYRENKRERATTAEASETPSDQSKEASTGNAGGGAASAVPASGGLTPELSILALAVLTGDLNDSTRRQARDYLAQIPEPVRQTLASDDGAEHAVYALLLHGPEDEERDLALLPEAAREPVHTLRQRLLSYCGNAERTAIAPQRRLPLLEMALPRLAERSREQHAQLRATVDALIRANKRVSIFEFTVRTLIGEQARERQQDPIGMASLSDRADALRVTLSLLAHVGHDDDTERNKAYQQAADGLGIELATTPLPLNECSLKPFSRALRELDDLQPTDKDKLLAAGMTCVATDQRIEPMEAELMTTIAVALNEPVPESLTN
jgi:Zn-dependent protease with chaperone function